MFTEFPSYDRYRSIRLTKPQQHGEDVYALQTALLSLGFKLPQFGADGYFGTECDAAVRQAQNRYGLIVDGLAGGKTQEALAIEVAKKVATNVPIKRTYGQLAHESGFRLGNYSPLRANGTFDAGVAQRNTALTPAKEGFTVETSIAALDKRVSDYYALFAGLPEDRRWDLAQGSWNAPAYAAYIAREEGASHVKANQTAKPSSSSRSTLEAYIASVSAYA